MYYGIVAKLENVRQHPNANRLVLATVLSSTVVISKDMTEGQVVIYFPSDGQLSEEMCAANDLVRRKDENGNDAGGFLDPKKRNVRIIRLRGEYSDGLVLPLESLAWTGGDYKSLKVGDTITVFNKHEICRKYVPQVVKTAPTAAKTKKGGKVKKKDEVVTPYFAQHVDTPQLRFVMNNFRPGDVISLTEKVHGTSSRNANTLVLTSKKSWFDRLFHRNDKTLKEYKYIVGTRRTTVAGQLGGYYGSNQFRLEWGERFKNKLLEGECVFGEIAGYVTGEDTPIMAVGKNSLTNDKEFIRQYGDTTTFSYGCAPKESRYFIYRMTYTTHEGVVIEYPWDMVVLRAKEMGFEAVPEVDRFIYTTEEDFMNHVNKWLDRPSTIDPSHVIEGVVVRAINDPKLRIAKAKSNAFKLIEGIIKAESAEPDMEEAEDVIEI